MKTVKKLVPEWYQQEAIILAWPDKKTDWAPWLTETRRTYIALMEAINKQNVGILLLIRQAEIDTFLSLAKSLSKVMLIPSDYNDTWVRDYGFLTCAIKDQMHPIEFNFNGWGNKFDATKDNQINRQALQPLCQHSLQSYPLVMEGGALEIDQHGNLLSTAMCLQNPQRNGDMSAAQYSDQFAKSLAPQRVVIFEHGHLEGDDTDGHVDTLVRFTPDESLVVQSCFNHPTDSHFAGLNSLVNECKMHFPNHRIFELPLPQIYNEQQQRLPASYANYLINNHQVLCPTYQQPEDKMALTILAQAYPQHQIVAIDALPLIRQFGSIHCISMQVPCGTLKKAVLEKLNSGISIYE